MIASIEVAGRTIGPSGACFVIAEAGVNHNGDPEMALRLIDVAAEAGADAVKFQTFRADRLATSGAPKADYQRAATAGNEGQLDMLRKLELSPDAHRRLQAHCAARGILFLSTPFDEECADLLASLGVPAFKTPSGELTNLAFLAHVARKGRPMLVSTGMATLAEVDEAVRTIRANGNPPVALLHCVSDYPADPASANLRALQTLEAAFGVPAGYSDHTPGLETALAAAALGACIIEKHFTLDRSLPGPDHAASIEPAQLAQLITGIRAVESALGDGRKAPAPSEAGTAEAARKRLVAARDIAAGERISADAIGLRRAGTGLPLSTRGQVVGRIARVAIRTGAGLTSDMFE